MKTKYIILFAALLLAWGCNNNSPKNNQDKAAASTAKEIAYYTCPMHPQVHKDEPGKCPICGMDLVPVMKSEMNMQTSSQGMAGMKMDEQTPDSTMSNMDMEGHHGKDSGSPVKGKDMSGMDMSSSAPIQLSPQQQFMAGVKIVALDGGAINREIVLTGTTSFNPNETTIVSAWVGGWIQKSFVRNPGEKIRIGQKLYELYSPDLLAAENDYRTAVQQKSLFQKSSVDASKTIQALQQKMLRWGLSQSQINRIATERPTGNITIYSKKSGILFRRIKVEGDFVNEGETVFELVNNDHLWVRVQLYDTELDFLSGHPAVRVKLENYPGILNGKIAFNNPVNQTNSRVYPVFISIPNPGGRIQNGMLAKVYLQQNRTKHFPLSIPASAVVYEGGMTYVWVALPENQFKRQMVQLGESDNNRIRVLAGLNGRDKVVSAGVYLVNSEYRLKTGGANMAGMQMSDMKIGGRNE